MHLVDYKVRVINGRAGTAARVRVVIESQDHDSVWGTVGVSENIIEASWLALVDAFDHKLTKDARSDPKGAAGRSHGGSTFLVSPCENLDPRGAAPAMTVTQEFLILASGAVRHVYGIGQVPDGTVVGQAAQRLRIVGPVWVKPPNPELTPDQWATWQERLREAGFSVRVEPFWTSSPSGHYVPLNEVADELLGSAR